MKTWMIRGSLVVLALGLVGALVWNNTEETADEVLQLRVKGAEITVEQFRPPAQEPAQTRYPTVLMLHGMDGAEKYGRYYRQYARTLSENGFQVFYVHYFDGSSYGDLFGLGEDELGQTILRDRDGWIENVVETVELLSKREDVDPENVGLLGFSLGGFVSIAATERIVQQQEGLKVAAVVEFFSGLFEDGHGNSVVQVDHFPPMLILHGELDERVPVAKAQELHEKLTIAGVEHEMKTYPDKGHGILGEDAGERTIAFFEKHLK